MYMARIEMRLFASLQKWKPIPVIKYDLAGTRTVKELLLENGIPENDVAIIMINGKRGQLETTLRDGDAVSLFPLIGGG
jgi:molybdopterin synthase sulfur carrier subunit